MNILNNRHSDGEPLVKPMAMRPGEVWEYS
jgi:hypothetical protein